VILISVYLLAYLLLLDVFVTSQAVEEKQRSFILPMDSNLECFSRTVNGMVLLEKIMSC